MEFQDVELCSVESFHLHYAVFLCHSWQAEYHMAAHQNISLLCSLYCSDRTLVGMTTVYALQHLVVCALYAILHNHESLAIELFQIVQDVV